MTGATATASAFTTDSRHPQDMLGQTVVVIGGSALIALGLAWMAWPLRA